MPKVNFTISGDFRGAGKGKRIEGKKPRVKPAKPRHKPKPSDKGFAN